jgi:uncharacterized protein with von Willebrand factor type A (vWA) domain
VALSPDGTNPSPGPSSGPAPGQRHPAGGIIHTYQKYDPKEFPSPTTPPPDVASAAFEHMLQFGSMRDLSPEELARAIHLDPSMFPMLGPSLESIAASLKERKIKILETYETETVQHSALKAKEAAARDARPPKDLRGAYSAAMKNEQLHELERIYYKVADGSEFASDLIRSIERLGEKYQVEELASKYEFTGRESMSVPEALEIKAELEMIDKLLEQLKEAAKNAQLAIIDMSELSEFAEPGQMDALAAMQQQIEDYIKEQAAAQGLEHSREGYKLGPQSFKIFQGKLLREIFSTLQASRSGRHDAVATDDGVVEMAKTRPYAFGDSVTHMDIPQSFVNGIIRQGPVGRTGERPRLRPEDIEIHDTKKSPRCATSVVIDMSGSMRNDGQYINAKRMALALDGLIRSEFSGDFLSFVEVFSLAKIRHISEIPALMPKPVSIRSPRVRLRADLSDPKVSESAIPAHFTNLQHGLRLARQMIAAQDTPNRQIMLITDGLPTAHMDGQHLYLLYPPDPATEEATMREARACAADGITINVFLLPNWWQTSEDVQFAHRMAEQTKGRVFFTAGRDLDRFVLWDYVKMRRSIIG